jgi:RNA polymerase sigma-70 factor, ECF subfamily
MARTRNDAVEEEVRSLADDGKYAKAIDAALKAYEPELRRWIKNLAGGAAEDDIFAVFCEDLWKGFENFRWESSFQTWAYCLARNAAFRHLKARGREHLLGESMLLDLPHRDASQTQPWLRSEVKSGFTRLREQLTSEEQTMIVLRVEREMSWDEIARVTSSEGPPLSTTEIQKKAVAMRQHFKRLKARLRRLAAQQGLLDRR